jgi:hypothetical protein
MAGSTIAAGIGATAAVAGAGASIFGGGGADTSGAEEAILRGQALALAAQEKQYEQARSDVAPWRSAGGAAVNQWSGLLGLPGYTALDPTSVLTSTPGYKFLQDQGTQALARYGAATGLGASGAAMKGAANYGQNLAQTYAWQPYMSSLQSLSGQGLNAASASGNYAMTTGTNEANTYTQGANQLAQLELQQSNANNAQMNSLVQGLGFAGSQLGGLAGNLYSNYGSMGNISSDSLVDTSNAYSASSPNWRSFGLKADGGPVKRGRPYIVGERGPELIYPEADGFVVPNHLLEYSAFGNYRAAA